VEKGELVGISEVRCPSCDITICVACEAAHPGLSCEKYQKIPACENTIEDIEMHKLAAEKLYARCPRCHRYVEHAGGCDAMACRCGECFSYREHVSPVIRPSFWSMLSPSSPQSCTIA
jgi:hypothetical protein